MTSTNRLEKRVSELESESAPEGERPPELTIEEKEALAERFDVDSWDSR